MALREQLECRTLEPSVAKGFAMRVLIVEDDSALGKFLQKGLQSEGHEVVLIADGRSGLDHVIAHEPDLLILDLTLRTMDGIQVLEELQGKLAKTSVLVLTDRTGPEERVKCFLLGADQLMSKPFSIAEFTARCKALSRRRGQIVDTALWHRGIELNRVNRRVSREGRQLELTGKEFALLEHLMQARGRCCTRNELLRDVWQMSPDAGTNVVDVYVNYLRKKLDGACPDGGESADHVIQTVRGEGYVMGTGKERRPPHRSLPGLSAGDSSSIHSASIKIQSRGLVSLGGRHVA